ncbi:hypothetical protein SARC_04002 [Sphaeroforma arctica JP610]|uniref:DUF202 domain-containing protein n=1 Tax=Sphaeroforma arctica JP610 TaxID=667725 RepID=A0A0L0G3R5_9EUKA|nr:hypothetical protein SARC_04002 [Sphaeroforma arctica JP610]KNC83752.1 hypothetical protein SARC_04002 [Sphaeroforma arctica JP610]|eukprot:XP_014157654.1 hypothetical protein SARC_04002 [Sphaeroforma arctica JP610]
MPARIEPKVFFANERTFLSWVHTAVLISASGLAMMHLSPDDKAYRWARIAGAMLVPSAMTCLVYGLWLYQFRSGKLSIRSPGPYQAYLGPILVSLVFLIALILNFAVALSEEPGQRHKIKPHH